MITMENYEGWLMRYADGELTDDERRMTEAFLDGHPDLREELDGVAAVRVTPMLVTMPHKERLLHKDTTFAWWRVAASVAVLVLSGTTLIFLTREPDEENLMAEVKPTPMVVEPVAAPVDTTPAAMPTIRKRKAAVIAVVPENIAQPVSIMEEPLLAEAAEPQPATSDSVEPEPTTLSQPTATIGIISDARLAVNPWLEALMASN